MRILSRLFLLVLSLCRCTRAFLGLLSVQQRTQGHMSITRLLASNAQEEAAVLLERARKMREELAELTGQTIEQVEQEAAQKKEQLAAIAAKAQAERTERQAQEQSRRNNNNNGSSLQVPETADDQVRQAKAAIERAYADNKTRHIIRFALLPDDETLQETERTWPGGPQQMYREAAGPMTRLVLKHLRIDHDAPVVHVDSRDIWDFDGSALITSSSNETEALVPQVRAMVLPNTDNKYTHDIAALDAEMKNGLVVLVNPFWRDLESWGFNILAPNAKQLAQEAIFDAGFTETYCCIQKSVRGEACVAIKAYPYDWQLYAYAESDYYPYAEYSVHLGSTEKEPKASDFTKLLEARDEFKLSKNMRQMQRLMNKDD